MADADGLPHIEDIPQLTALPRRVPGRGEEFPARRGTVGVCEECKRLVV